jgi:hypothetical protein
MCALLLSVAILIMSAPPAHACTLAPVISVAELADPLQSPNAEELEMFEGPSVVGVVERRYVKIWPEEAGRAEAYAVATVRFWGERLADEGPSLHGGGTLEYPPTTTSCGFTPPPRLGDLYYVAVWDDGYGSSVDADRLTTSQESLLKELFGPPTEVAIPDLPAAHPYVPQEPTTTTPTALTASTDVQAGLESPKSRSVLPQTIVGLALVLGLLLLLNRKSSR